MEHISPDEIVQLRKCNTERLRCRVYKLSREGDLTEEEIDEMSREQLLDKLVELIGRERQEEIINTDECEQSVGAEGSSVSERVLLKRMEYENERKRMEYERALRQMDIDKEISLKQLDLEIKRAELKQTEFLHDEDTALKRLKLQKEEERENSLLNLTKKYGDIIKLIITRFPCESSQITTWFENTEALWETYEVPDILRGRLIMPHLTFKARSLVARMPVEEQTDYCKIKPVA